MKILSTIAGTLFIILACSRTTLSQEVVHYDSLGTYTVEGTLLNLDSEPLFASKVQLSNWTPFTKTTTNLNGRFSIRFQVTKKDYDFNKQVYIEFNPSGENYTESGVAIPVRNFTNGYFQLKPMVLLTREQATVEEDQKTAWGFMENQIESLKNQIATYPGRIDSLQGVIRELREKQVRYLEHLVQPGDWLTKIAADTSVYGDEERWRTIYEANRDVIADPNLIYPNQILKIPVNPTRD